MDKKYCSDCGHEIPDVPTGNCPRCYRQLVDLVDLNSDEKIKQLRLADEVYVLNVGGYIGSSTRKEIEYAESLGKLIRYLESEEI